jgi:molybdopterin molybdotransferase
MIELTEALSIVLDAARPLSSERVDLDAALNRVLAEDIASDIDMPPFDESSVDGYACRRRDMGRNLVVIETIPAGRTPKETIGPDQCARIAAGAMVPQGADYVAMAEHAEAVNDHTIQVKTEQAFGNILPRGAQTGVGQVVLRRGCRVKTQHIGILASVGCVRPLVTRRPKVVLLAAGVELVEPGEKPGPAQVRNSNGPQLAAQLARMGIGVNDYGIVRDIPSDASRVLAAALTENDVVLIVGDASVADRDSVSTILRQQGVEIPFEEIAVKPGRATVFGRSRRGTCFGLFGKPASAFVIFDLLIKPFLWRLMGHDYPPSVVHMPFRGGTLTRNENRDLQTWIPVRIVDVEAEPYHNAARFATPDEADGLAAVDSGVARVEEGTPVPVRLILD